MTDPPFMTYTAQPCGGCGSRWEYGPARPAGTWTVRVQALDQGYAQGRMKLECLVCGWVRCTAPYEAAPPPPRTLPSLAEFIGTPPAAATAANPATSWNGLLARSGAQAQGMLGPVLFEPAPYVQADATVEEAISRELDALTTALVDEPPAVPVATPHLDGLRLVWR